MSPGCLLLKPYLLCSHRRGYNNVFQAVSLLHRQQGQDKVYGPQRQAWSSDRKGKGVQEIGLLVCDPRRQDRKGGAVRSPSWLYILFNHWEALGKRPSLSQPGLFICKMES